MDENSKKIRISHEKRLIQTFPQICSYSCSKNNEIRNFVLTREYKILHFFKFKAKFSESIKITCDNCGWKSSIPSNFAKKIFKNGVKANLIIRYSRNKVLTSRFFNFWGSLWRLWLAVFGVLIVVTVLRFRITPILKGVPPKVTVEEALTKENLGKVVEITGKADYTLSILEERYLQGNTSILLSKNPYLPIFTEKDEFIVIKGSDTDLKKIEEVYATKDFNLIKNTKHSTIGKVQVLEGFANKKLENFFFDELPKSKSVNRPLILINSKDVVTLKEFSLKFLPFYIISILLLISSTITQIYLDKKLFEKNKELNKNSILNSNK